MADGPESSTQSIVVDQAIADLAKGSDAWAQASIAERLAVLAEIKEGVYRVAREWADTASRKKQIPLHSPLEGEEWISGPYALLMTINSLTKTLKAMEGRAYLQKLRTRQRENGQLVARVMPYTIWDRLLLSGVRAEVWMQDGVTKGNLPANSASAYCASEASRKGRVATVLGAGNIASIAPLDCFHKLFAENQVVALKMNPVNDYLTEFLEIALKPLTDRNALKILKGGAEMGQLLCTHPDIEEIHITGAAATHDAIVWGDGAEGEKNKKAGTPINPRRVTSELGAVCPTIVVPGPWSAADLQFQAEHIATQKLHNSGFNCIACQVLILPSDWHGSDKLLANLKSTLSKGYGRPAYYPGVEVRMKAFAAGNREVVHFDRAAAPALVTAHVAEKDLKGSGRTEVFAPAMSICQIKGEDAETYLRDAIELANDSLDGTLGANIIIHPATIRQIGRKRFEALLAELRYGTIGVNAWTGVGFLLPQCPWGAFPGHSADDIQSGTGFVHNAFMFDRPERTIVSAPFRPFPRSLFSSQPSLLPRPPWFVTNKRQRRIGKLLTAFQYRPAFRKLPRLMLNALRG